MSDLERLKILENKLGVKFTKVIYERDFYFETNKTQTLYFIDNQKNVTGLQIKNFELNKLPEIVGEFKNLKLLSLENVNITDISLLKYLKNMQSLTLSHNNIEDLSVLSNLRYLIYLKINNNKIKSLEHLKNLSLLRKLLADYNQIEDLTPLHKLRELTDLSISANNISDITHVFSLRNLKKLDVSENKIKKIDGIRQLDNLIYLDISQNQIRNIDEIANLQSIRKLIASGNKITTLPDLRHLDFEVFDISFNNISEIDEFKKIKFVKNIKLNTKGNPASRFAYIFHEPDKAVLDVDKLIPVIKNIFKTFSSEKAGMIGIFGRWGRGKTFLWKHLKKQLEPEYQTVEFSAWKYNDTPASWGYFYETLADGLYGKPKFLKPLKIFWKRFQAKPLNNILILLLTFGVPVFFLLYMFINTDKSKTFEVLDGIAFKLGTTISYVAVFIYFFIKVNSSNVINVFKRFNQTKVSQVLGLQAEIEKEIVTIVKNYKKQIIVFVDDLDRCEENRILSIIDALRVVIENKEISGKVIIITAVDEKILEEVIRKKYQNLAVRDTKIMVKEYMEKLFVFAVKLPELAPNQINEIAENYAKSILDEQHLQVSNSDEYKIFMYYLAKISQPEMSITPRQIKNVYNRLRFATNLFIKKHEKIKRQELEILGALIFYFSFLDEVENFNKFEASNVKVKGNSIYCTIFEQELTVDYKIWPTIRQIVKISIAF